MDSYLKTYLATDARIEAVAARLKTGGTCVPLAAFVVVAVALHVEVDVRARSEASHAYKANDLASAH
jgi:hypothetical protein